MGEMLGMLGHGEQGRATSDIDWEMSYGRDQSQYAPQGGGGWQRRAETADSVLQSPPSGEGRKGLQGIFAAGRMGSVEPGTYGGGGGV